MKDLVNTDGQKIYLPWYFNKGVFGGKLVDECELAQGQQIPGYYGKGYRRYDLRAWVIYPKPIHLIARFLHWLDWWTVLPCGKGVAQ